MKRSLACGWSWILFNFSARLGDIALPERYLKRSGRGLGAINAEDSGRGLVLRRYDESGYRGGV